MASSVAAARLAGGVSRPVAWDAAATADRGLLSGSLWLPMPRRRRHGIRCCRVGNPGGGMAAREEFVGFFREAWPYIRGHRGSTFPVVISSEVVSGPHFDGILQDISLLHGLGIKFVLVPGIHVQIDKLLSERGSDEFVEHESDPQ